MDIPPISSGSPIGPVGMTPAAAQADIKKRLQEIESLLKNNHSDPSKTDWWNPLNPTGDCKTIMDDLSIIASDANSANLGDYEKGPVSGTLAGAIKDFITATYGGAPNVAPQLYAALVGTPNSLIDKLTSDMDNASSHDLGVAVQKDFMTAYSSLFVIWTKQGVPGVQALCGSISDYMGMMQKYAPVASGKAFADAYNAWLSGTGNWNDFIFAGGAYLAALGLPPVG